MLLFNSFINGFMCAGFSVIDLTEFSKWIEAFFNIAGQGKMYSLKQVQLHLPMIQPLKID